MRGEGRNLRLLGLCIPLLLAAVLGCGDGKRLYTTHGPVPSTNKAAAALALTADGMTGVRVGSAAAIAQNAAVKLLGRPDRRWFGGCELGGPAALYSEVDWSWGGLTLDFSNRASTRRVAPGRFLGWAVNTRRALPRQVRLPAGISLHSSPAEVRAATPISSAREGLPGVYELRGADGIDYAFMKPYHHVDAISLNPQVCE